METDGLKNARLLGESDLCCLLSTLISFFVHSIGRIAAEAAEEQVYFTSHRAHVT